MNTTGVSFLLEPLDCQSSFGIESVSSLPEPLGRARARTHTCKVSFAACGYMTMIFRIFVIYNFGYF